MLSGTEESEQVSTEHLLASLRGAIKAIKRNDSVDRDAISALLMDLQVSERDPKDLQVSERDPKDPKVSERDSKDLKVSERDDVERDMDEDEDVVSTRFGVGGRWCLNI